MVRVKSKPQPIEGRIIVIKKKPKRKVARKSFGWSGYKIFCPNESNQKYYLGEIEVGRTNNTLPDNWEVCKLCFMENNLQIEFDKVLTVIVTVTQDITFLKDICSSKIFSIQFICLQDILKAELYITEIPLNKFNKSIASTLKRIFADFFNLSALAEDEIVQKRLAETKEINEIYKKLKEYQLNKSDVENKPIEHSHLKPILRQYQNDAVKWMMEREKPPSSLEMMHPLYEEVLLKSGVTIYFNKHTGEIDNVKPLVPSLSTGGVLADEMGLGKTVEVLACILCNPKPEEFETSIENVETRTPTINKQSKKRKAVEDDLTLQYVDKPKQLKLSPEFVKGSSKKSTTRIALEMWYENVLQGNTFSVPEALVQCICGDTSEEGLVECSKCFQKQHAACLGYKEKLGDYICPKCWMEEPLLESKATLIVSPYSLRSQWCEEICKHVSTDMKVLIYEGSKANPVYPTKLKEYDLVLTTYNVLQCELRLSEAGQSTLLRRPPRYSSIGSPIALIKWWRLCLDEAQTVEVSSSMIATMAKKLHAYHRWAITGTPISRDISDLYGLIDYLQLQPYNEFDTWNYLLYLPYLSGDLEPMFQFLTQVMWRSSKEDVTKQVNIPPQTIVEYSIEFSAVEKYYYQREHELCSSQFLGKLNLYDCDAVLGSLYRSNLNVLMAPLLTLRQACAHPGTAKGRYLTTRKSVTSMEGLLEALIEKNKTDSEENLRLVVSSLNGQAGVSLLSQNPVQAVEMYRQVLQLAARFNVEDSKKVLSVDALQHIHALYNLSEVLATSPVVPPTLHDDTLKDDCSKLEELHMEKYISQNVVAYHDSIKATEVVTQLEQKFNMDPSVWYCALVDWIIVNDLMHELYVRIDASLDSTSRDRLKFSNERQLPYLLTTWHEDIINLRLNMIQVLHKMYTYSPDSKYKIKVNDEIVQAAVDCHLRPQKHTKKKKSCLVCTISVKMRHYETKLFNMSRSVKPEDLTDMSNTGNWKPSSEEVVLKAIYKLGTSKRAEAEPLEDGKTFFAVLQAAKKEFKQLRKFWTNLDQQVCAQDEINMCKIRLNLKEKDSEDKKKPSRTDNILRQLSSVLENKLEFINLIEPHELNYQMSVLKNEEVLNMRMLEKNLGIHSYLETLRSQQYAGQQPDPCPICKNALQESWSILPCGHCYCLDCIHHLLDKCNSMTRHIACSICRHVHEIEDVSYIKVGESVKSENSVKGNYSTKVESVLKLVIKLKTEDEKVKILIFSTWDAVLKILDTALKNNDVESRVMLTHNLQKSIDAFKNESKNVTVLLLPVHLGSKGLNLIEASHVIFVEPLLNPADELQAIGRVHRIGQTKPTTVHKFIIKNTIEESIHQAISSNAESWDKNKVTIKQLRNLFRSNNVEANTGEPNVTEASIVVEESVME